MSAPANADLRGQHAIVTGGGRGIGAAIALALAQQGARLTLMGRTAATLDGNAAALRTQFGAQVNTAVCDVAQPTDVVRAFSDAARALGEPQILINNAGQAAAAAFDAIPLETWNRLIAVNLTGTFLCTQQVLPSMARAGYGRIVNVASTAGLKGYSGLAAYCTTKHGVVGLTRALAVEAARANVTVNAVCPGYTEDTEMFAAALGNVMRTTGVSADEARARLTRGSLRRTAITPQEVAHTVAWLCSPEATAITGQAIAVASGEVM
jgi:NAD(P)-dependent dehydrogenase (short-subunit alcohol dehydrogenase family)